MFRKVLLATDGSDHSLQAADFALQLARKHDSQVKIIHVVQQFSLLLDTEIIKLTDSEKMQEKMNKKMMEKGKEIIAITAQKFDILNLPYDSKIEVGDDPADIICREAENDGVDLIIIGTRGHKGISRFLLGSVSSKVVSHAPCSVSVIR